MATPKHTTITCPDCNGHGVVPAYTFDGRDFDGPTECSTCEGSGSVTKYPSGALAKYPGGPMIGREAPRG